MEYVMPAEKAAFDLSLISIVSLQLTVWDRELVPRTWLKRSSKGIHFVPDQTELIKSVEPVALGTVANELAPFGFVFGNGFAKRTGQGREEHRKVTFFLLKPE